jgi:hypothetical protein
LYPQGHLPLTKAGRLSRWRILFLFIGTVLLVGTGVALFYLLDTSGSQGTKPDHEGDGSGTGATGSRPGICDGLALEPGVDIQATIDEAPPGATLCLEPGIYRLAAPLVPKTGQTFVATRAREAIISGARAVDPSQITRSGDHWVIGSQIQQGPVLTTNGFDECRPAEYEGCRYPEQVFLDDDSLWQVTNLSELSTGEFFFDYTADRIYLADDPAGRRIEVGLAQAGFGGRDVEDVTIDGLVVERFNTPAQGAALHSGPGWVITNCEVRYNNGGGIFSNSDSIVDGCYVHHQGQIGMIGQGTNLIVENSEIAYNGVNGYNYGWEGGGSKWVGTSHLTVRNNHVHDNAGSGLWTDVDNINTLYENNRVERNSTTGIVHEISYDAVIRNNVIRHNGWDHPIQGDVWGAGILIDQSTNVEVYGNSLKDNAAGITAVQQPEGSGAYGLRETRDLYVHDNIVHQATGIVAGLSASSSPNGALYYTSKGNRWEENTYFLGRPDDGLHFRWSDGPVDARAWKSYGHDVGGEIGAASD